MMKRLSKCLFVASQTSASDVTLEMSFDVRSFIVRLQLKFFFFCRENKHIQFILEWFDFGCYLFQIVQEE